jgi:hypothetical protein
MIMNVLKHLIKPVLLILLLCTGFSAQAVNWTKCADDGKECVIPNNQPVMVRYGHPDYAYLYYSMAGVAKFTCNNFNGDPMPNIPGKTCSYTTNNQVFTNDTAVLGNPVASEGQTISDPRQKISWVRYGIANSTTNNGYGSWWNTIQSAIWKCNTDAMNFDPTFGQSPRKCYPGKELMVARDFLINRITWTKCGDEGKPCTIDSNLNNTPIVLRYGTGSIWTYRLATLARGVIKCETGVFNESPTSEVKTCDYTTIVPAITVTGQWNKIASLTCAKGVAECPKSIDVKYVHGTNFPSKTSDVQKTAWGNAIATSIKNNGLTVLGGNNLFSNNDMPSSDYENSLQNYQQASEGMLNPFINPGDTLAVYQFAINAKANCLRDGSCDRTTLTKDLLFVRNPPSDYKGPQCVRRYTDMGDKLYYTCAL